MARSGLSGLLPAFTPQCTPAARKPLAAHDAAGNLFQHFYIHLIFFRNSLPRAVPPYSQAQALCLVKPQHQVHILDGRAAGPFAQVVKQGGDRGMRSHCRRRSGSRPVSPRHGVRGDHGLPPAQGGHMDQLLSLVVVPPGSPRPVGRCTHRPAGHCGGRWWWPSPCSSRPQWGRTPAARFSPHRTVHFRQVLVLEVQAINAGAEQAPPLCPHPRIGRSSSCRRRSSR